jgi:hypothetical protein
MRDSTANTFKPVHSTAVLRNGADGGVGMLMPSHPRMLPVRLPMMERSMPNFSLLLAADFLVVMVFVTALLAWALR